MPHLRYFSPLAFPTPFKYSISLKRFAGILIPPLRQYPITPSSDSSFCIHSSTSIHLYSSLSSLIITLLPISISYKSYIYCITAFNIAPTIILCQKDESRKKTYQGMKTQECWRISSFYDTEKFSLY